MNKEEIYKLAMEQLIRGVDATVVMKEMMERGIEEGTAAMIVRISQHKILEAEKLEKAIQEANDLSDADISVHDMTMALLAGYGMYMGAKAVHHALLRKGIINPSSLFERHR